MGLDLLKLLVVPIVVITVSGGCAGRDASETQAPPSPGEKGGRPSATPAQPSASERHSELPSKTHDKTPIGPSSKLPPPPPPSGDMVADISIGQIPGGQLPISFPLTPLGETSTRDVVVQASFAGATVTKVSVSGPAFTVGKNDTCTGRVLPSGGQCLFTVVFEPHQTGASIGDASVDSSEGSVNRGLLGHTEAPSGSTHSPISPSNPAGSPGSEFVAPTTGASEP